MDIYFIIGTSNSGKSTLAFKLAKQSDKPVYVMNDRTRGSDIAQNVSFKDYNKLKNCCLIVEDMICLTEHQRTIVQNILTYNSHHFNIEPIFLLTHSISKNNVYPLLPFVKGIMFMTCSNSTINTVKTILRYFSFDKKSLSTAISRWQHFSHPYHIFLFNVETNVFDFQNLEHFFSKRNSKKSKKSTEVSKYFILQEGERIFKLLGYKSKLALDLLNFITEKLTMKSFDEPTFSITMKKHNSKQIINVNLIQFVMFLIKTSNSKTAKTPKDYFIFYKILLLKHNMPLFYVCNPLLKKSLVTAAKASKTSLTVQNLTRKRQQKQKKK